MIPRPKGQGMRDQPYAILKERRGLSLLCLLYPLLGAVFKPNLVLEGEALRASPMALRAFVLHIGVFCVLFRSCFTNHKNTF